MNMQTVGIVGLGALGVLFGQLYWDSMPLGALIGLIIILVLILCCCCGNGFSGNGCGNSCGCNDGCC